jgi:hypothetical protein
VIQRPPFRAPRLMLAHVRSATEQVIPLGSAFYWHRGGCLPRCERPSWFRELMCSSLLAELVDGHRFADEGLVGICRNGRIYGQGLSVLLTPGRSGGTRVRTRPVPRKSREKRLGRHPRGRSPDAGNDRRVVSACPVPFGHGASAALRARTRGSWSRSFTGDWSRGPAATDTAWCQADGSRFPAARPRRPAEGPQS